MSFQPITSPIGDLFYWESSATIASNSPVANANRATDFLQVNSDSSFLLMAFLGSTNYDAVAGDFIAVVGAGPAAARTLVTPPLIPNNFEVLIRYNAREDLMDSPMPQACICSNGYRTGMQMPFPVLFAPMTTFDFTYFNVAQTILTLADKATVIPLQLTFGLMGYFIPNETLAANLTAYDAYAMGRQAMNGQKGWIKQFTSQDKFFQLPGL
jgi:hypothetical protein